MNHANIKGSDKPKSFSRKKDEMKSIAIRVAVMLGLFAAILLQSRQAQTQEAAPADNAAAAAALAKQLSNPVASLVSIPFQFNWDNGIGPNNDVKYTFNMQPVMPFSLSKNVNLIARWIMPYVSQPSLFPGGEAVSGYGDIVASAFLSPANPGFIIWGIGPVFSLPTTTNPLLGSGKWAAGPTMVLLRQQGKSTFGVLVNHLMSFSNTGDVERNDLNASLVQPFLSFSLPKATTFGLSAEATANWEADKGKEWTVPILVSISKVTKLGPFPFSLSAGVGSFAEKPLNGPEWKIRTSFTLLLPRGK